MKNLFQIMKKKILKFIWIILKYIVTFILKKLNLFVVYRLGDAIGDQLCMTAIIEELANEKKLQTIVVSRYSELFDNNPNVYMNISFYNYSAFIQKIIKRILFNIKGEQIECFSFEDENYSCLADYMRETKSKESLIEVNSKHFNKKLNLKNARPKLYFSDEELLLFNEKFKDLPDDFVVIQPIGKTTYTPNKEWSFNKFQEVVDSTPLVWLQTGLKGDKVLSNVLDYTSKTKNIRELSYIISKAKFVLCLEGLLNHLASAVNTKSFVIFSGFSFVEIADYSLNVNISNTPQVECSPCWLLSKCPLTDKSCTEDISVQRVKDIIQKECKFL